MKTVTAPTTFRAITASPITRTHNVFLYLFPIQSWRQFVSTAIIFTVGLSFFAYLIYRYDPDAMVVSLLGGVVGGAACGLYPMLPGRIKFTTRGEARHFLPEIQQHMKVLGYVESGSSPTRTHYRSKFPRWVRWDEQDMEIAVRAHAIEVNGPVLSLRLLTLLLNRAEDERNRMG